MVTISIVFPDDPAPVFFKSGFRSLESTLRVWDRFQYPENGRWTTARSVVGCPLASIVLDPDLLEI